MAVIRYKCTVCDREIELIEQPTGLERTGRCLITNKCRGQLYRIKRLEDFAVGKFPSDVIGLTNHIQRNVLYNHSQAIADQTWIIEHNLGVNPSVQIVVDREEEVGGVVVSSRLEVEPQLITIIDKDHLTILFDRPETGLAQIIARSSAVTQTVTTVDAGITYLPVSQSNILTIGVDCSSGQFPAGTVSGTQLVRLYFLDQETLDETAFESAAYKDYAARSPISTSAWNDASEVFVNGQLYTVLTIDIGDPVNDFGAPAAGAVLFQSGTDTSGFAYDQSPNMVVLLSDPPHANIDKNRWQLFRPEINVGPTLALDSFIFANGELFIDQTKIEDTFPPIFSVSNDQNCPVPVVGSGSDSIFVFVTEGSGSTVYAPSAEVPLTLSTAVTTNSITAAINYSLVDVRQYNGTLVAVGGEYSVNSRIWYSTDRAANWTEVSAGLPSGGIQAITVIASGFLVVGYSGDTSTSADGISWSSAGSTLLASGDVKDVHYGNGVALAIAATASLGDQISRSVNEGVSWSNVASVDGTPTAFAHCDYDADNDEWVVVANTSGIVKKSTDGGATWSTAGNVGATHGATGIAYGNSIYVTVGDRPDLGDAYWIERVNAPGASNWNQVSSQFVSAGWTNITSVRFFSETGQFVATGDGADNDRIAYSSDGATWTFVTGDDGVPSGVQYNAVEYLA